MYSLRSLGVSSVIHILYIKFIPIFAKPLPSFIPLCPPVEEPFFTQCNVFKNF